MVFTWIQHSYYFTHIAFSKNKAEISYNIIAILFSCTNLKRICLWLHLTPQKNLCILYYFLIALSGWQEVYNFFFKQNRALMNLCRTLWVYWNGKDILLCFALWDNTSHLRSAWNCTLSLMLNENSALIFVLIKFEFSRAKSQAGTSINKK